MLAELLEHLTGNDPERRSKSAEAIALLGSWAIHKAAPVLLARLDDDHTQVRVAAATTLLKASPIPLEFLPHVLNALRSQRIETRTWCYVLLGESGTDHPAVRAALLALAANDTEAEVRWAAARAAGLLGEGGVVGAD